MDRILYAKGKQKKARVAVLIIDKIDFKSRNLQETKNDITY
jgi:translation initiation factor IF-1